MPWCVRKCPYCDFNSHQLKSPAPDGGYIDALLEDFEAEMTLVAGRRIESVFFGGGTPSLFPPADFARVLRAIGRRVEIAADVEITMEANPGTIERGRFAGYREAGINRLSLGAQTFAPRALELLGRIHTPDDTLAAIDELRAAGIDNFNIDLMYALPNQTLAEAEIDVATACALGPAHVSHYQLTLEPGTAFHSRPPELPDEDSAWIMQLACQRRLAEAGYQQYEVSAYARPGARCRHNLNYWQFGDYLGIGAGAHGKITFALPASILRSAKPKQPRDYRTQIMGAREPIGERKLIGEADLPFEYMLNALRLNAGFRNAEFEARTGLGIERVAQPLEQARKNGLMVADDDGWRPTELGRRFLNDLQGAFLA